MLLEQIYDLIPPKPYCTDDYSRYGLAVWPKELAVKKKNIQLNGPTHKHFLIVDIDGGWGSALNFDTHDGPPPNISLINRENGNCHYIYMLETPVRSGRYARNKSRKAERYYKDVKKGLTASLGGDPRYSAPTCKNPFHEVWSRTVWRDQPYELNELAEYIPSARDNKIVTVRNEPGQGRNCTLFDYLRLWAYTEVRGRRHLDRCAWEKAVEQKARFLNAQFPLPLNSSEVRAVAKSVAGFVYINFNPERFSRIQSERGSKKNEAVRSKGIRMLNQGWKVRQVAEVLEVTERTVKNWKKIAHKKRG